VACEVDGTKTPFPNSRREPTSNIALSRLFAPPFSLPHLLAYWQALPCLLSST
jgi:hypothetical protein